MTVLTRSISILPLLVAGCAVQLPVAVETTPPVVIAAVSPTKVVETRYDVRAYREAAEPSIRHEAHAIFRRTRVPVAAGNELPTAPRESYPSVSVAPLPASEELNAELATQKKLTAELRAMQAALAETGRQMQAQYAVLVRQSADALTLREQLEKERNRVRTPPPTESVPAATTAASSGRAEVKW